MIQPRTKKIKLEITEAQLKAICNAADTLSAMIGALDEDFNRDCGHTVKMIDRALNNNGYKRKYK